MVKTLHPLQGMQVQSPARALRSYMLCGAAKKKKTGKSVNLSRPTWGGLLEEMLDCSFPHAL